MGGYQGLVDYHQWRKRLHCTCVVQRLRLVFSTGLTDASFIISEGAGGFLMLSDGILQIH